MDDDTPYHALYVIGVAKPKRQKGRSFSDRKDGENSLASYSSASTSAPAKMAPPVLNKNYESKPRPNSGLAGNRLRAKRVHATHFLVKNLPCLKL
jgi:hypothetical protein